MQAFYEITRDTHPDIEYWADTQNVCQPHFHQQIELLYVQDGRKIVTINNRTAELRSGQLAVADSFDIHSYSEPTENASAVLLLPHRYIGAFQTLKRSRVLAGNFVTDIKAAEEIFLFMQSIAQRQNGNELLVSGLVNALLGLVTEALDFVDNAGNADLEPMRRLLIYIEENYFNSLTLEELSARFGYSRFYFSRMTAKYLKCTLSDYINSVRMRKAAGKLLENPSVKLADVAHSCGFNAMPTFFRCFKAHFNMTPGEYVQNASENII